jgi:hypothetical protein
VIDTADIELIADLEEQGYRNVRRIAGVLCGTLDYQYTRGLTVGLHPAGFYERRYCYQERHEADAALAAYTDPTTHPGGAWIKVKGEFRGAAIDALNPNWPVIHPWDKVAPT